MTNVTARAFGRYAYAFRGMALALLVGVLAACGTVAEPPSEEEELVTTADGVVMTASMQELVGLVNEARSEGRQCGGQGWYDAADPLTADAVLMRVAEGHAEDQKAAEEMSHKGSNGSWPSERVSTGGYPWRSVGENVAWGYGTPEEAMEGWLDSPGHCSAIMNPSFSEIGVARAGLYWTQVFAAPR